jgi:hypothetical protein
MRDCLLLSCVALVLAALAPPAEAIDHYDIRFRDQGPLGVLGGKVRVVFPNPEDYSWELRIFKGETTTIRVLEPGKWTGWYLAYDMEGKDEGVSLVKKRGPGTEWLLTKVEGKSDDYTLQAAQGKLKGWYLDVEEKGEKSVNQEGKTSTAYRVFLSEKPKRLPQAIITLVAP